MGTRVIRLEDPTGREWVRGRHALELSATALTAAIAGAVLAATLLIASLSVEADPGRGLTAGIRPEPAPPPTLATPRPGGAPVTP